MSHAQWFLVEIDGPCRWTIRHQVTGELAGHLVRTPAGYLLNDHQGLTIGSFPTLEQSVEGLYEFV